MKRIISMVLGLLMILSSLSMFSVISFAETKTMTIKPSRFGAWENWINSPNLMGNYDSTTQLLVEATNTDGTPLTLPQNAKWELTITNGSVSKTIQMNPATTYSPADLYRFETCNGKGENKFVPVKGTNYTVSAKITSGGEVIYQSAAVSGFTCPMDPVDPAIELPEPEGTATLTLGAWYGKIENWGTPNRTYFIVGMSASECNDILYIRLKNGRYKMYVTVTDETADTTKTVYYPFNKASEEVDGSSFIRLALGEKGIDVVKDHAYTLEIKVYNQAGELKYTGKSAKGAFASTQEAFLTNGPIDTSHYPVGDPESPLFEKSVLFVGDSITEAICEVNISQTRMFAGWPGRIGVANNMYFVNKGLSGASISTCRGSNTVLNQLIPMKNRAFDLVIMHGGANDAWDSTAVGKMTAIDNFDETTFDQTTFAGGLEYLFWYAKTYYPDSVLGYIINFQLPGSSIGRLSDMSEYFNEAKKICDKWDIPYLDMYNNEELNARMKGNTRYAMGDYIHPNDRGYDILYPYIEQFCECILEGGDPSTLTDPAPLPDMDNGITEDDINLALGKPVKNGAGTTSYTVTDGSVDAYFMAGNWDAGDGKCYIELDLGTLCNINKINVVNYVGNLLYQWEAYITTDNTLSIDKWTNVGGMLGTKMAYEDGNTVTFDTTKARYVRVYGIYDNASSAFVFNEVSVYGEVDESGEKVEVAGGNTATLPSGTTDKLTDGNKTSDPAVIAPIMGGSVTVDLGAVSKLSEIKVFTYSNLGAYQVYASNDGSTWTYIGEKVANATGTVYDASFGCQATFATAESYRYIKIQGIESARTDYCCALAEVEIYNENGGKLTPASATANRVVLAAKNSIDGNYTSYSFIQRPEGHTVIDLGEENDLRSVIVYPANVTDALQVQVSVDNKNWITIGTLQAGTTAAQTYKVFGSYRYIRLAYTGADEYSIYEIEVFAIDDTPDESTPPAGTEEELTARDEVTITLGNGSSANGLKDGATSGNYTLIAEGDKCYALIDLQKTYTVTKAVIYALNGNYLFEIYGSNDNSAWTKLCANEASSSYNAAEGFVMTLSGNYRYIKVVGTACQFGYFTTYEMDVFGYEVAQEPDPDEPTPPAGAEEELTARDEVTITLGNGSSANGLKDGATSGNYTLIAEGDKCYALIDLQKTYTVTKAVIYALNGNYLFEIYGSNDNSAWTKLCANEASSSYNAAEGFVMTLSGNYRYIKVVGTACQFGYFTTYEMDVFGYEVAQEPDVPTEPTPTEEELSGKEGVTVTVGAGLYTNNANDGINDKNYALITQGDNCYVILDLQKTYTLTKAVVYTINKGYSFKVYGSNDGTAWTELGASAISDDYVLADGYTVAIDGNYRYVKIEGVACQNGYFTIYEIDVYGYEAKTEISDQVKFEGHQMGNDGTSIRFIGSVSGLDYESVDLKINVTGDAQKSFSNPTTTVFQILKGSIAGVNQAIAATSQSGITGEHVTVINANYLFGYAITDIDPGTYTFEIIPTATLTDGSTVTGKAAYITITIQ